MSSRARALAPLKILCDQAFPLIERGAIGLFPKGQDVEAELTEAAKYWNIEAEWCRARPARRAASSSFAASRAALQEVVDSSCPIKTSTTDSAATKQASDPASRDTSSCRQRRPILEVVVAGRAHRAGASAPRVLAIANQKGGVGKTTTAINLGTALAAIGEHVLIVDLDPQGNASTGLGIDRRKPPHLDLRRADRRSAAARRGAADRGAAALHRAVDARSLRPRARDRPGARPRLPPAQRARRAQRSKSPRADDFSYVLVDCPPSLNLLTVNAMAAANAILVPLQCEFFALEGLSQLLQDRRAGQDHAQSEAVDPRHRADDVRRAQQSLQPGRRRRARVHGPQGLRHRSSRATCASRRRRPTASRCWSTI